MRARFADRTAELIRRIEAQPGVAGVTFADRFPGLERWAFIEVERYDAPATDTTALAGPVFIGTRTSRIGLDLFDMFDVPILAGRGFDLADARAALVRTGDVERAVPALTLSSLPMTVLTSHVSDRSNATRDT